jgi:hypothetical protein
MAKWPVPLVLESIFGQCWKVYAKKVLPAVSGWNVRNYAANFRQAARACDAIGGCTVAHATPNIPILIILAIRALVYFGP